MLQERYQRAQRSPGTGAAARDLAGKTRPLPTTRRSLVRWLTAIFVTVSWVGFDQPATLGTCPQYGGTAVSAKSDGLHGRPPPEGTGQNKQPGKRKA